MKVFKSAMVILGLSATLMSVPAIAQSDIFEFAVNPVSLKTEAGVRKTYTSLQSRARAYCKALELSSWQLTDCQLDVVSYVVESSDQDKLSEFHRQVTDGERIIAAVDRR